MIKGNSKYCAISWETGGGGAFVVFPNLTSMKASVNMPKFSGH